MRHRSGGRFLIPRPAIQFVWVGRPTPCLPMAASPPSSPSLMDPKATSCLLWVAGRTEAPTPTALSSSPSAPLELWRIGQLFPSLVCFVAVFWSSDGNRQSGFSLIRCARSMLAWCIWPSQVLLGISLILIFSWASSQGILHTSIALDTVKTLGVSNLFEWPAPWDKVQDLERVSEFWVEQRVSLWQREAGGFWLAQDSYSAGVWFADSFPFST
jgi:hypothetical protein